MGWGNVRHRQNIILWTYQISELEFFGEGHPPSIDWLEMLKGNFTTN